MTQVSKYKLDKYLEIELSKQFWYYLGAINNHQKSFEFFSDFLTNTEKIMFIKRFAVAILVVRDKPAIDIKRSLHVSNSTICSVSAWLKNAKPETQKLLQKISKEKNWEMAFDKIDEILDNIPPRRGTDWKEAYAEKRERLDERLTRKQLR